MLVRTWPGRDRLSFVGVEDITRSLRGELKYDKSSSELMDIVLSVMKSALGKPAEATGRLR